MNGNTRGEFSFARVATAVIVALTIAGIGWLVGNAVDTAFWRGSVDEKLLGFQSIGADSKIALDVVKQHGQEFLDVRESISGIRGQLVQVEGLIERRFGQVLDLIEERARDRFKGADWDRERNLIELRFETIRKDLQRVEIKVDEIQKKMPK